MGGSDTAPGRRAGPLQALALLLGGLAVLGLAAWGYGRLAPDPDAARMVRLELAGSLAAAQRVVGADTAAFADALRADFLLIGGYVAGLLLLGTLGRGVLWTAGPRQLAGLAMAGAVGAGALDVAENLLLLDVLHPPTALDGDLTMRLVQAAAFAKFTVLAAVAGLALVVVGVTLSRLFLLAWERLSHPARPRLEPDTDVLAPAQPPPAEEGGSRTHWKAGSRLPPGRWPADVGIAASGGGIRSACVTLGALQSLRDRGELQRAGYLVSVSGGGYMAGAFQLALQPLRRRPGDPPPKKVSVADPGDVFAPGSAEEDHLRRHSSYIADGARQWMVALWTLLRGVVVSLALLTLTVAVAGLLLAGFYTMVPIVDLAALRPRFVVDPAANAPAFPTPPSGVLLAIGATAAAAFLSFVLGVLGLSVLERPVRRPGRVARALAAVAALLIVVGLGVPAVAWASARLTWGLNVQGAVSTATGGALGAVLLTYLGTLAGVLWRKRETIGRQVGVVRGWLTGAGAGTGTPRAVPTSLVQRLIVLAVLLLLALGFLAVLGWVVATAPSWPRAWRVGLPVTLVLCATLLDQTWLGLHPFYRRRLASAFAVRRLEDDRGRVSAEPYPFDSEGTPLWDYAQPPAGGRFPRVIFAAAANLSGQDRTPPGRHAVSYTLASDFVGGPDVGWVATAKLQRRVSPHLARDLTVQAAMAISGAAFASAMGRQARAFQTFFALSNARLGAWLPNPAFLYAEGVHWTRPRLPRLRRLSYLLREILGRYPCDNRLLYCTDGGHYENLGLVELLRQRCRLVYCIDASGDTPPLSGTLAEAITLAYEELGVRIELDQPLELVPGGADPLQPQQPLAALSGRLSRSVVCTGTITYPEDVHFPGGTGRTGRLVVMKAGLTGRLPYELLSYASRKPVFPRDSTSDQWFDHGQFDAYQELGRYLGDRAADAARRPAAPAQPPVPDGRAGAVTIAWSGS